MNPNQIIDGNYRVLAENLSRYQGNQIKQQAILEAAAFELTCLRERLRAVEALLNVPFAETLPLEEWELGVTRNGDY